MTEYEGFITDIMIRIAGDIVLSENPGRSIRRWREFFEMSQAELAG
jgi:Predicted transcriptional regulator